MAQLEIGLYGLLVADPAVSALVADRIYPVHMKEKSAQPSVVYQGVSINNVTSLDGQNALTKKRIQYDCYDDDYITVKALEKAICNALINYRGTLSEGTEVQDITLALSVDLFEQDPFLFRVTLDFEVWFIAT